MKESTHPFIIICLTCSNLFVFYDFEPNHSSYENAIKHSADSEMRFLLARLGSWKITFKHRNIPYFLLSIQIRIRICIRVPFWVRTAHDAYPWQCVHIWNSEKDKTLSVSLNFEGHNLRRRSATQTANLSNSFQFRWIRIIIDEQLIHLKVHIFDSKQKQ